MTTADTASDAPIVSTDYLFFWGEYELIDWEKVHAGESGRSSLHESGSQHVPDTKSLTAINSSYLLASLSSVFKLSTLS